MRDRATEYAEKVVIGDITAGKPHIQACQRHLNDLEKQGTKEFPYLWKPDKANEIIDFAETLTISEGEKPKPVKLFNNQCFDLGVPHGWVRMQDGYRRFRRSYESMARQNGKTFKNGIRASYYSNFGGYNQGKLFTAATKRRQANLAWEETAKFIRADPELSELYQIQDYKWTITALLTNCTIESLSKESGLDDGFRSIFNSIDEIHQHKDNSIYQALYRGTRGLKETLNSMITTRGHNLNSFCYEMDKYALNILSGVATAEDFFVDIYTMDEGDDYFDPKNFLKANPVLCQSDWGMEIQAKDAQTAKDMGGSELSDYIVKCCNVWYRDTANAFVNADKFEACGREIDFEDFRGKPCWIGLDLSSGGDLTSWSFEFEVANEENAWLSHSYMPRGRFAEHIITDIAPYDVWEKQGLITVTGGEADYKNDYKFIVRDLKNIIEKYELLPQGIGADPHNIDGILSDLEEMGCPITFITQSAKQLNDATCDMQLMVDSLKMHYPKANELMAWSFVNAITVSNSFGEIKVDKQNNGKNSKYKRIDPVDSSINAHVIYLAGKKEVKVDLNAEMERYLSQMGWSEG